MMRLAGTLRAKMGSRVEESWWISLRVGVPRSNVPGSPSSRMTMHVPLRRGSSDSTAAVTKLAKPMLVMKRPRFSTRSMGSCPSTHSLRSEDHARALEARVVRFHRGRHEIGETHVGDEAAALLDAQYGFLSLHPFAQIGRPCPCLGGAGRPIPPRPSRNWRNPCW